MERTVRILGLREPLTWTVTGLPEDPMLRDAAVGARLPGRQVDLVQAVAADLLYVARPAGSGAWTTRPGPEVHLVTSSGPDAGRVAPLPLAGLAVGRGASDLLLDDPAAPSTPLRLRMAATGLSVEHDGSGRREQWDGRSPLRVGATGLELLRGPQSPLSPTAPVPPAVVELGTAPGEQPLLLPILMAGAPLIIGGILALTTGSPLFLVFSLVSALAAGMTVAHAMRSRRRHARRLTDRAAAVASARRAVALGPGDVSRAARSGATDRFGILGRAGEALCLHWGEGTGPFGLSRPDASQRWTDAVRVPQPALTCAAAGSTIRLDGPPRATAGMARWVLFQMLRHAVASGSGLREEHPEGSREWWPGKPSSGAPGLVLRTDSPSLLGWAHSVWAAAAGLPASGPSQSGPGDVVVDMCGRARSCDGDVVDAAAGTVLTHADGRLLTGTLFTGVSPATLLWWLSELADDVSRLRVLSGGGAPPRLRLPEAVGGRGADVHLRTLLTPARKEPEASGPVSVDLVTDGPHLLIAGTTGSGKSDLLLSLLLGLAAGHPPAELALILLDFKGGASFGVLAGLPHTMSVETNHVGASSLRALQAIQAELRRREALFAATGVPDYPEFRRARPRVVLPRLVVAVDELRVLLDEHPDAAAVLQRLAATGRSLGFHLVLATQRATGAVSSDVRSNLGATIALRTATEQESWDLVGSAAAHRLDPAAPGSALLTRPGRPDVAFRAAAWEVSEREPVWRTAGSGAAERPTGTHWALVVGELQRRYAEHAWPLPARVVSPGLPRRWCPPVEDPRGTATLALLDDAAHARHDPWSWGTGSDGSTAWIVEPAGGRAQILTTVLAAARRTGPVLVLDGSGEVGAALGPAQGVTLLTPDGGDEAAADALRALRGLAETEGTVLITGWVGWSSLRVAETFRSFEDDVHRWLGTNAAATVRVAAFGGRELATSRLLLHLPHRFYVPAGTTPEHRLVWPRVAAVEPIPGRAVYVSPECPEPGVPAQLAFPADPRDGRSAGGSGLPSTL